MIVPDTQLVALAQARNAGFFRRAVGHLRRVFPEHCSNTEDEALHTIIANAMARGAAYDMVTERQVVCLIDMVFLLGEDFEQRHDWARLILADPRASGDEKRRRLYEHIKQFNG